MKFVGNIHGNEVSDGFCINCYVTICGKHVVQNVNACCTIAQVVSRDLLLRYIDFAIEAYGTLDNITYLLNTTRLHLLVSMNPDGFEEALSSGLEGQCKGVIGR